MGRVHRTGGRVCAGLVVAAVTLAMAPNALAQYTINTLGSFYGSNGAYPLSGLTLSGNKLYGTTYSGGDNYDGAVFSVPVTGGTPTVLASFNGSNGMKPWAGLTLSGNTLYGTTADGGTSGFGTVFSVPITGGRPTVLASFNGSNGATPYASLTLSGNTLYGTTEYGSTYIMYGTSYYGNGNVFSLPVTGGTPTVLASFNGNNGVDPYAGLKLSGNRLYGTTQGGGAYGDGEVFSVPITGGTPTVLASFNGSNGKYPYALTLSGNTLYGTTQYGGIGYNGSAYSGDGVIFSIPITGGTPTVLASFDGSNGMDPYAGLTLSGNTLYGTTKDGGSNGYGTVFSITVPEPSCLSLMALAAIGLLARRRMR